MTLLRVRRSLRKGSGHAASSRSRTHRCTALYCTALHCTALHCTALCAHFYAYERIMAGAASRTPLSPSLVPPHVATAAAPRAFPLKRMSRCPFVCLCDDTMVLMCASLGPACASWCEEGESHRIASGSHATTRIAVVSSPLRSPALPRLLLACTRRIVRGNVHHRDSCHAYQSTYSMAGVSRFGVATRPRVGAIPSSLEPRACQDYVVLDRYIACSATKWTGYLLVPQVGVADGCAILVANAPHQVMRVRPQ
jgi:hypothetical protein